MKGEQHRTFFTLPMERKEKETRSPTYLVVMNDQGTRTLPKLSNNKQQI